MERRLRTNLVLVVVLIALGGLIVYGPETDQETDGVPMLVDAEINRIAVHDDDQLHLALERDDGIWRLVSPFALPAEDFQVNALLAALREPARRRYPMLDVDSNQFGFDQTRLRVEVDDVELRIGGQAALGGLRYVQMGEHVYLVDNPLEFLLRRNPLDYASKRVLPEDAEIESIQLPDGTRIEESGNGWTLEPEDDSVSADALQRLVDAWRNATAMNVRATGAATNGSDVRVVLGDGRDLRFRVEMTDTGLKLARTEPAVTYHFPQDAARRMLQPAGEDSGRDLPAGEPADE